MTPRSEPKALREDPDSEEGMEWEPLATESQALRRREAGELQYQDTIRLTNDHQHHPSKQQRRTMMQDEGFDNVTNAHSPTTSRRRSSANAGGSGRGSGLESPGAKQRRIIWWRQAAINLIYILAWYTFSTLISVYNKWMFSKDHYNFPYPLFVTSVHMLVQWILSALVLATFKGLRSPNRPSPVDYATKVIPCGIATGLDIGLSNLSLRTITLSFYTMCKSSSLVFVLVFAFLFRLEKPSWRLVGVIVIITSGVVLMVSTETQFNATGMIEVITASALGGLRWSLIQVLLEKEAMGMSNPFATLFWLAPIMGATLAICSMIFDGWSNVFGNAEFFGTLALTMSTCGAIFLPGCVAFLMNVTEFGLIQRTSVVTLSVAGIFKEVAVIFMSTVIFHDQLTPINISGLVVTLSGIGLYNYMKYSQFTQTALNEKHKSPPTTSSFEAMLNVNDGRGDDWDEEGPLLSPRASIAERRLNVSNASAKIIDEEALPQHMIGEDEDDGDSVSSATTIRK